MLGVAEGHGLEIFWGGRQSFASADGYCRYETQIHPFRFLVGMAFGHTGKAFCSSISVSVSADTGRFWSCPRGVPLAQLWSCPRGKGFLQITDHRGAWVSTTGRRPLQVNRRRVRPRPCKTDFTQIAIAADSFFCGNPFRNFTVFCTFLIHRQNRLGRLFRFTDSGEDTIPFCSNQ